MNEQENLQEYQLPDWINVTVSDKGKETRKINEPRFCEVFREEHDLARINETFFLNGEKVTDATVKKMIQEKLEPYFTERTGRKTDDVFITLSNFCFAEQPEPDEWKIYLKDDTTLILNREGNIDEKTEKVFTLTRLPVQLVRKAECPTFRKYLSDLFYPEDIPAIQEFIGYCLVPSTRAQAGMFIHGEGGEGKSVLRDVLMRLFGHAAIQEGIHELGDAFTMINLENKLICIDDDMRTELLNETNTLKKLITARERFQLEAKFKQKREGYIFARVIAIGNSHIGSKFDHSEGFYRRQLLIDCKPKTRAEKDDDRFMSDKCIEEISGILWWALAGLIRLIRNNYNFTISKRMRDTLDGVKHEGNNVLTFAEDNATITFTNAFSDFVTSAELFRAYAVWCMDNGETPIKRNSFARQFPKIYKLNITDKSCGKGLVPGGNSQVQGYTGMRFSAAMTDRLTGLDQKALDKIDRLP